MSDSRLPSPKAFAGRVARRSLPRIVVAGSRVTLPARLAAAERRRRGVPARVELFFAFDDPCSAVASIALVQRLSDRPVELVLLPVVSRGIAGDPAVVEKRDYAVIDARRLARRSSLTLTRPAPLAAADTAFLAEWVAGAAGAGNARGVQAFTVATLRRLWLETSQRVDRADYLPLWREHMPTEPHADAGAVRDNERRMRRRGPYETPAAWVGGRWYFAHDRIEQICEWLDELGWASQ